MTSPADLDRLLSHARQGVAEAQAHYHALQQRQAAQDLALHLEAPDPEMMRQLRHLLSCHLLVSVPDADDALISRILPHLHTALRTAAVDLRTYAETSQTGREVSDD